MLLRFFFLFFAFQFLYFSNEITEQQSVVVIEEDYDGERCLVKKKMINVSDVQKFQDESSFLDDLSESFDTDLPVYMASFAPYYTDYFYPCFNNPSSIIRDLEAVKPPPPRA